MAEVCVDTDSLRLNKPSGNVIGCISLSIGTDNFPDSQWHDFPIIILGWWIEGLLEVVHGRAKAFEGRFMDGPYSFLVEHTHGTSAEITLQGAKVSRFQAIDLRALFVSATAAAANVVHASKINGWSNADLIHLETLLGKARA